MDLLCSVLLNDGDTIIVEGPTYPGAIHAMRNRGARFLSSHAIKTDFASI